MSASDLEVSLPAADERRDETTSSAQALCLVCGLCCDGTLFHRGYLKPDDPLAPLTAAGMDIAIDHSQQVFTQPCAAHDQGRCTVYANRPGVCRHYRCELLKRFIAKDVQYTVAMGLVERTKSIRDEVRELAAETSADGTSSADIWALLHQWLERPEMTSIHPSHHRLFFKFSVLRKLLDRFFLNTAWREAPGRRNAGTPLSRSSG